MLEEILIPVIISLSERTLTLPSGEVIPVAIGKPSTPTPTGVFHVVRKVRNPNGKPNGFYGSRAIMLNNGIGIHGTNDQSSIGLTKSAGCVRIPIEYEGRVFREINFLTEVVITK